MNTVMNIVNFVMAHQVIEAGLIVAICDFLFALNKNIEANGVIHAIYVLAKGKGTPPQS